MNKVYTNVQTFWRNSQGKQILKAICLRKKAPTQEELVNRHLSVQFPDSRNKLLPNNQAVFAKDSLRFFPILMHGKLEYGNSTTS